jgi:hypothetical protein
LSLTATDSKEFKRPRLDRSSGGVLVRDSDGRPVVLDNRGFFTQLGCTISFERPQEFRERFISTFREVAANHRVALPRLFVSARTLSDQLMNNDHMAARSFLYHVLDGVKDQISSANLTWLIFPKADPPTVVVGGAGALATEVTSTEFVAALGNMNAPISAWHYWKTRGAKPDEMRIDHFQGRTTPAWTELTSSRVALRVVPWGDESDPFICMADIFCFLTDKRLHADRKRLSPAEVEGVWRELPFPVHGSFMDHRFAPDITWIDEKPIQVAQYFPSPMTYLLVDDALIADSVEKDDEVSFRQFLQSKGFVNAVVLDAQLKGGGFKKYHEQADPSTVKDGDHLVYMGAKSKARAEALSYALSITYESVADLRARLRGKGFSC